MNHRNAENTEESAVTALWVEYRTGDPRQTPRQ